jgi:hypothetical protein
LTFCQVDGGRGTSIGIFHALDETIMAATGLPGPLEILDDETGAIGWRRSG